MYSAIWRKEQDVLLNQRERQSKTAIIVLPMHYVATRQERHTICKVVNAFFNVWFMTDIYWKGSIAGEGARRNYAINIVCRANRLTRRPITKTWEGALAWRRCVCWLTAWMDRSVDEWMDGCMRGWMYGWMGEWLFNWPAGWLPNWLVHHHHHHRQWGTYAGGCVASITTVL